MGPSGNRERYNRMAAFYAPLIRFGSLGQIPRFYRAVARALDPVENAQILDAVVFSLSLTTLPDPDACVSRALSWLRPGGQLVVLDSFPDPARPLARRAIHWKGRFVGADPARTPLERMQSELESVRLRHFRGGVYTLVSGRRPGHPGRA